MVITSVQSMGILNYPTLRRSLASSLQSQSVLCLSKVPFSAGDSLNKTHESKCKIAAVGWWLGCNLSSWSLISKSGLDLWVSPCSLSSLEEWCHFQLFFQQRDNYRLKTQLMNKCVGFSSMDHLVRRRGEVAVINTLGIRPSSPVILMCLCPWSSSMCLWAAGKGRENVNETFD